MSVIEQPMQHNPPWLRGRRAWLSHAVVILIVLTVFVFSVFRLENVHRKYGDAHTQALVMVAGKNFVERGLIATRFTPLIQTKRSDYSSVKPEYGYYTHYPPFPYYVGALVWSLGGRSLVVFKMVTLATSCAVLLLFYCLIANLVNQGIAMLSTALYVSHSLFFEQVMETPPVWSELFQMGAFLFLVYALELSGRRKWYALIGSWVMLFLNSYSSFELILSSQVFVVAYTVWKIRRKSLPVVLFLTAAPVMAFFLHFLNNAWVLGGMSEAFDDLFQAFMWRTLEFVPGLGGRDTGYLNRIGGIARYPLWLAKSVWSKYGFPYPASGAIIGTLLWVLMSNKMSKLARNYLTVTTIFGIANITYWVAFPQATRVEFVALHAMHLLPTYGLLLGGACYFLVREISHNWQSSVALGAIALLLMVGQPIANNVKSTAQFIAASERNDWSEELQLFKRVTERIPLAGTLIVEEEQLTRFAFYHQPREVFGLPEFEIYLVRDLEGLSEWTAKSELEPVYLLKNTRLSSLIQVESSWKRVFDYRGYVLYKLEP